MFTYKTPVCIVAVVAALQLLPVDRTPYSRSVDIRANPSHLLLPHACTARPSQGLVTEMNNVNKFCLFYHAEKSKHKTNMRLEKSITKENDTV